MSEHIEGRLVAYVDGELSTTEARAVEAHAATCERCSKALAEMRSLAHVLESDTDAEPLAPMWNAVGDRLERRVPVFDAPFAAATAAALAIGMVIGLLTFDRAATQVGVTSETVAPVETWPTESEVLLSDAYLSVNTETEASTQ